MENLATGNVGQFITNWTFNILDERFLAGLPVTSFAYNAGESVGSNKAVSIDVDANDVNAVGGGGAGFGFDIGFKFDNSNGGRGPTSADRFMQGETCVYDITYTGALTGFGTALFNAKTENGLLTSAHVQGIPLPAGGTTSGAATVPEPASLVLWSLLGAIGMGIAIVRRRHGKNG